MSDEDILFLTYVPPEFKGAAPADVVNPVTAVDL
jgi:hypothetical protein